MRLPVLTCALMIVGNLTMAGTAGAPKDPVVLEKLVVYKLGYE